MLKTRGKKTRTYNIICFGFMPWSNMWKREQSMMAEISKCDFVNRLIFVNPDTSIRGIFKRRNGNRNDDSSLLSKLFPLKITKKIFVYTPLNLLPNRKYLVVLKKIEIKIMLRIIRQLNKDGPYMLFMNCPNIFSHYILDELLKNAELSLFDFSDDFVELNYGEKNKELFGRNIAKYAKVANIVLTVNDHIKNKYASLYSDIHVIRNATNYYNFDRKNYQSIDFLERVKQNKKTIIGYSGIANMSRIDVGLLDFLLEKKPDWQFVFIGPTDSKFTERYLKYKNVHFVLPVDYQSLPDYTRYFDVAVVPFKINEHTNGNDLLKFHDFLAMGKPIVSTRIGGANDLKDVIRIAQRPSDFLEEIENALLDDNYDDVLKRKNVAMRNSWPNRVKELEQLIKRYLKI